MTWRPRLAARRLSQNWPRPQGRPRSGSSSCSASTVTRRSVNMKVGEDGCALRDFGAGASAEDAFTAVDTSDRLARLLACLPVGREREVVSLALRARRPPPPGPRGRWAVAGFLARERREHRTRRSRQAAQSRRREHRDAPDGSPRGRALYGAGRPGALRRYLVRRWSVQGARHLLTHASTYKYIAVLVVRLREPVGSSAKRGHEKRGHRDWKYIRFERETKNTARLQEDEDGQPEGHPGSQRRRHLVRAEVGMGGSR